jgi:hypothetical protein
MLSMATPDERMVAVLHDVIEESASTLDDLRGIGLSDAVLDAIDRMTHRESEPYDASIERLADDPRARSEKIADLRDNLAHNHGFPGGDEIATCHRAALDRLAPGAPTPTGLVPATDADPG